jgi:hypothetical protein
MNKNLDEYLVSKYPKIFKDRKGNIQESCMPWGFELDDGWFWLLDELCDSIQSHIDHNSKKEKIKNTFIRKLESLSRKYSYGSSYHRNIFLNKFYKYRRKVFYNFSEFLSKRFEKIIIETIPQVVAIQVKEKYGTLNFYYSGGDRLIDGMVRMVEGMSFKVCETCGSTHNVGRTSGWIYTICKDCYDVSDNRVKNLNWKLIDKEFNLLYNNHVRKIKLNKLNN